MKWKAILILLFSFLSFTAILPAEESGKKKKTEDTTLPGYPVAAEPSSSRTNSIYSLPFGFGMAKDIYSKGLLVWKVLPEGAEIRLDGRVIKAGDDMGTTGALQILRGIHTIELTKEGYVPYLQTFGIQPFQKIEISRTLQAQTAKEAVRPSQEAKAAEGYLELDVQPPDATVYLGGSRIGTAGDFGSGKKVPVPAGYQELFITAPHSMPYVESIEIEKGKDVKRQIRLNPLSAGGAEEKKTK
jgi:hypothetical protein